MKVTDAPAFLLVSRSLPPAPAQYDRYLNATENVGTWGEYGFCPPNSGCTGTPTPSCKWVTTIMNKVLTNDSGPFNKIQVVFALAPPEFPFTIYTISLYNVNDTSSVSAVNVTKDFPSHVFKRISPGTYIVKVLPFDPYFNQGPDRCLCKNEYSVCSPCTPTITRGFTVGYSMYRDLTETTTAEQVLPFDPYFNQASGRCLCKNENSRCLPCTPTITSDSTVGYTDIVAVSDVSSQAVYHEEGNICLIAAVLGGCFGVLRILFS
nr:uncharacterized protein LOC109617566 isoform X1 [Crassostrea gigas]